jgi:hypothetical protein
MGLNPLHAVAATGAEIGSPLDSHGNRGVAATELTMSNLKPACLEPSS